MVDLRKIGTSTTTSTKSSPSPSTNINKRNENIIQSKTTTTNTINRPSSGRISSVRTVQTNQTTVQKPTTTTTKSEENKQNQILDSTTSTTSSNSSNSKDFRCVVGWMNSLFTSKNEKFVEILENTIKNVGLKCDEIIMTETGKVFEEIAQVLSNDQNFTNQIRENISTQFIKIIVENAKNLLPTTNEKKGENDNEDDEDSKFSMEANLGDTNSFFGGLSKLIGDPHPDLVCCLLFL